MNIEYIVKEESQASTIGDHGTPGMRIDQSREMSTALVGCDAIRRAVGAGNQMPDSLCPIPKSTDIEYGKKIRAEALRQ